MSMEGPRSGARGENAAADFLGEHFLDISRSQTGYIDLSSYNGLRKRPDPCQESYLPFPVTFHFQVKRRQRLSRVRIERPAFEDWLQRSGTEPVIVLYITKRPADTSSQFHFLVFHDWLLRDKDKRATSALVSRDNLPIFFLPDDFLPVDENRANFWNALMAEADRAGRFAPHPFTTLAHNALYPANEACLLLNLEVLPYLEVSRELNNRVSTELQLFSDTQLPTLLQRAVNGDLSLGMVLDEWWPKIRKFCAIGPSSHSFERAEFRRFIDALIAFRSRKPFRLPRHKGGELACWRLFVSKYPYALNIFEHVLSKARRLDSTGDEIISALTLLPLLALSGDRVIESRVMTLLSELDEHVRKNGTDNYWSYRFLRQYYRTRLEIGQYEYIEQANDILFQGSKMDWEERFLKEYGWWPDDLTLLENLARKIDKPSIRDENTRGFHQTMRECLIPIVKRRNPESELHH
jgi:hypothetical protein